MLSPPEFKNKSPLGVTSKGLPGRAPATPALCDGWTWPRAPLLCTSRLCCEEEPGPTPLCTQCEHRRPSKLLFRLPANLASRKRLACRCSVPSLLTQGHRRIKHFLCSQCRRAPGYRRLLALSSLTLPAGAGCRWMSARGSWGLGGWVLRLPPQPGADAQALLSQLCTAVSLLQSHMVRGVDF